MRAQKQQVELEYKILQGLTHDKVIRAFHFYEDNYEFCLLMEHMSGGDLFDRIATLKRYCEEDARFAVSNILQGIEFCHSKGVIHRFSNRKP
jgi:serine/threonine protein kinase